MECMYMKKRFSDRNVNDSQRNINGTQISF